MALMRIPYVFSGTCAFQPYSTVQTRIDGFSSANSNGISKVVNIGRDQSNTYDMQMIDMGNVNKPPFLLVTCMHPPEWETMQYTLSFMEMLRDNTFPDVTFRSKLLSNFRILYIPFVNPWGYNKMESLGDPFPKGEENGRLNSRDIDLNRNFTTNGGFTEQEAINVKNVIDTYKAFSVWDGHMYAAPPFEEANDKNLIIGNGTHDTYSIRNKIQESWVLNADGQEVHTWPGFDVMDDNGLVRRYAAMQNNPYTGRTLSYITEMYRPTTGYTTNLSLDQIYRYGMNYLYLFFKTSMDYYYNRAQ